MLYMVALGTAAVMIALTVLWLRARVQVGRLGRRLAVQMQIVDLFAGGEDPPLPDVAPEVGGSPEERRAGFYVIRGGLVAALVAAAGGLLSAGGWMRAHPRALVAAGGAGTTGAAAVLGVLLLVPDRSGPEDTEVPGRPWVAGPSASGSMSPGASEFRADTGDRDEPGAEPEPTGGAESIPAGIPPAPAEPAPTPTPGPETAGPTTQPGPEPTATGTPEPTASPAPTPTHVPEPEPQPDPTASPTPEPTPTPTPRCPPPDDVPRGPPDEVPPGPPCPSPEPEPEPELRDDEDGGGLLDLCVQIEAGIVEPLDLPLVLRLELELLCDGLAGISADPLRVLV